MRYREKMGVGFFFCFRFIRGASWRAYGSGKHADKALCLDQTQDETGLDG